MKKLVIAFSLLLATGYVANNVYAAVNPTAKMHIDKDGDKDKDKDKKKKKGSSCSADANKKSCSSSSSTQKSCCSAGSKK